MLIFKSVSQFLFDSKFSYGFLLYGETLSDSIPFFDTQLDEYSATWIFLKEFVEKGYSSLSSENFLRFP